MAPSRNNLFDFDCLEEQERPQSPRSDPDVVNELRRSCAEVGLSVGWCTDADTLQRLDSISREWGRCGVHTLSGELTKFHINMAKQGGIERADILWRLRCALVWDSLPVWQLEEECTRRQVPHYACRWWFTLQLGSWKKDKWQEDLKADLIGRLSQDSWREEFGPLPPEGIPGFWHPSWQCGRVGLPAWTGPALPPGVAKRPPEPVEEVVLRKTPERPSGWWPGPPRTAEFKDSGVRVCWYAIQFPWFTGPVPGDEAEFLWTDLELEAYFASNARLRPKPRPLPKPMGEHSQQQQQRRPQEQQHQRREEQSRRQESQQQEEEQQKQQLRPGPKDRHYSALGLGPGASQEDVRRAYRRLVLRYHPDKAPSQQDAGLFRQVQEAYEQLCEGSLATPSGRN